MDKSRILWRSLSHPLSTRSFTTTTRTTPWTCPSCQHHQQLLRPRLRLQQHFRSQRRHQNNPADVDPSFKSVLDNPPTLMRTNRKHSPIGLLLLATMPLTAFILGCWQVHRLTWKTDLIARFEDRLVREPLPLPPSIDPDEIKNFDYRRVVAKGKLRHDQEMLIGPRIHDGKDGYLVVTPLERSGQLGERYEGKNTTVLVCRGWIAKEKAPQSARPDSLPTGEVEVQGLLREPWVKNMFTPNNKPEESKWYFPDVHEMAAHTHSQPVWIEETMRPDLLAAYDRESKGIPIGRPPEVNLRNNHVQ